MQPEKTSFPGGGATVFVRGRFGVIAIAIAKDGK